MSAVAASVGAALAACGPGAPTERVDRPAKPPAGWRTVVNREGRFTFAVPKPWRVTRDGREMFVAAPARTTFVTLTSDRSPRAQRSSAQEYALERLRTLPGFKGRLVPAAGRVRGTPYDGARAAAFGRLRSAARRQRVTSVALRIPDRVIFSIVIYGGAEAAATNEIVRSVRSGLP